MNAFHTPAWLLRDFAAIVTVGRLERAIGYLYWSGDQWERGYRDAATLDAIALLRSSIRKILG